MALRTAEENAHDSGHDSASYGAAVRPVRNYSSSHRLTPRANIIEISRS